MKRLIQRIKNSSAYVKLTKWEFYPIYIANIPTVIIWLFFALKSRALFFFSAVNPVIETGGMFGESKINILNRLPEAILPRTIFIERNTSNLSTILASLQQAGIAFPLIAKPDIGERGFLVKKIETPKDLQDYLEQITTNFIIQDFVDLPMEISLLYHRKPGTQAGVITSLCIKRNLFVRGDGISDIASLMQRKPRARFQLDRFRKENPRLLAEIPEKDTIVELEPIGNHCRGTTFLDGNKHIDPALHAVFDRIALQMEDIYYGRFDLKCQSLDHLRKGEAFKVLEFNGVGSEPAHIYDPDYSVVQAYKDLYKHWKIMYEIATIQRSKGVHPMSIREALVGARTYFAYKKLAKLSS